LLQTHCYNQKAITTATSSSTMPHTETPAPATWVPCAWPLGSLALIIILGPLPSLLQKNGTHGPLGHQPLVLLQVWNWLVYVLCTSFCLPISAGLDDTLGGRWHGDKHQASYLPWPSKSSYIWLNTQFQDPRKLRVLTVIFFLTLFSAT
jgi:hypothetical protein